MNHSEVKDYYGQTLKTNQDLKTNACKDSDAPSDELKSLLKKIHPEVLAKYYGCGVVLPEALSGASILDLGSGSGRDCYLLAQLVGEKGKVIGVDMTPEQLSVANEHIDYHRKAFGYQKSNVSFLEGTLENLKDLPIEKNSIDVAISSCVINLVLDKKAVLAQTYDLLKEGGEFYFSDIYADRRIPQELTKDPVLYGECLSGAMYWNDFDQVAKSVGFTDPRIVSSRPIEITDPKIKQKVGATRFISVTYRLFKIPKLERDCEDYGQAVQYKGGIEHHEGAFDLDDHHHFAAGKFKEVCGNTFLMLQQTRLREYFNFFGDFSQHYGIFEGCGQNAPEALKNHPSSEGGAPKSQASQSCC